MKGRTRTAKEKAFHDKIASLGCIACRKDGIENPHVSIHHIAGRTRPDAHWLVLGLCYAHHQGGQEEPPSVHPWRSRFEQRYGSQMDLLAECLELIKEQA